MSNLVPNSVAVIEIIKKQREALVNLHASFDSIQKQVNDIASQLSAVTAERDEANKNLESILAIGSTANVAE